MFSGPCDGFLLRIFKTQTFFKYIMAQMRRTILKSLAWFVLFTKTPNHMYVPKTCTFYRIVQRQRLPCCVHSLCRRIFLTMWTMRNCFRTLTLCRLLYGGPPAVGLAVMSERNNCRWISSQCCQFLLCIFFSSSIHFVNYDHKSDHNLKYLFSRLLVAYLTRT